MKRNLNFDLLNVICCFCVVMMHGSGVTWIYAAKPYWYSSLAVDVLCYFSVPCFFMISGATLLDYHKRYDTKTFLKKRITRTLVPYIFWALFYLLISIIVGNVILTNLFSWNENGLIYQVYNAIVNYSSQSVFWYFPALFNVYLCIPILSHLCGTEKNHIRWYAILLSFISIICIPSAYNFLGSSPASYKQLYCMGGYLIYVLLGYQLYNEKIPKWAERTIYITAFICLFLKYAGTVYFSGVVGETSKQFMNYLTIWAFFPSASVFLLIQKIKIPKKGTNILKLLSSCSLSVYLIHKLFFSILSKFLSPFSIIYRTLGVLCVYCICIAISLLMKKIPFVRKLFP